MVNLVIWLTKVPPGPGEEEPEPAEQAEPGPKFEKTKLEFEVTGLRNPTMARNWLMGAAQTNCYLSMLELPIHQPQQVKVQKLDLDTAAEIVKNAIRAGEAYYMQGGRK